MTRYASRRSPLALTLALSALAGCAADVDLDEDLDPASSLGSTAWEDDGPPPGESAASSDEFDPNLATTVDAVSAVARFELPFPCGQVWAGQTRGNHSPTNAIDFNRANDEGDRVVASAAGTVTRVANTGNTSYGRWIEIAHGGGYTTRYAHLSWQGVRVGQRVSEGQTIGTVGTTGGSSGPHLHYELRRNGVAVRPYFHGFPALFWGTRNYTSQNACGGGGGGGGGGNGGGGSVIGRVNTRGVPLNVRSGPGTGHRVVGSVASGATVRITCQVRGERVNGTYGSSTLWDRIGNGYVSDAYVLTGSDGQVAPTCR